MHARTTFGALLGAGSLLLLAVSTALAAQPTYSLEVTKTADPATVPAEGGDVEFTVSVKGTGTGFFNVVEVTDDMVGCTLDGPVVGAGDDDTKLEENEIWEYTCTVSDVSPGTENSASAFGCLDQSENCAGDHDATDTDSVTVSLDDEVAPTEPPTDTAASGTGTTGGEATWLLVVALGLLLGSVVVLTPARPVRQRR